MGHTWYHSPTPERCLAVFQVEHALWRCREEMEALVKLLRQQHMLDKSPELNDLVKWGKLDLHDHPEREEEAYRGSSNRCSLLSCLLVPPEQ